jgi:hypothetical protein
MPACCRVWYVVSWPHPPRRRQLQPQVEKPTPVTRSLGGEVAVTLLLTAGAIVMLLLAALLLEYAVDPDFLSIDS